ncbi:MAG: homoaconitase [Thermoanaerobaculia bacterium]
MGQTVVEKIAQSHLAEGPDRPLRAGDFVSIRPRHILTHDNTAAVMKKFRTLGVDRVHDPRQPVFALDHDIQNTSEENLSKYRAIETFAREQGIDFYPAGTGIGHQIVIERGYAVPGSFVVASDSHSNMYGALGAVGTPVVRTDAAAVWATGSFWWQIPRTVQVVLDGKLAEGVTGKDVIIALCGLIGDEVLNAAIEFTGQGVQSLTVEERLTIANMSTEWGVLVAWFPPSGMTFQFLRRQHERLVEEQTRVAFAEDDLRRWEADPIAPDPDAVYAARLELDLSTVVRTVAGPDTVQLTHSLATIAPKRVKIDKAYLLSCVNSRLEDLTAAAEVLRGKKIAAGVKFYVAAASRQVQQEAERTGVWNVLVESGATLLPPSCGPCIGLGTGLLEAGEVGISATNRNFKGRMGSRDAACYLASPAVVAASALEGVITAPGTGSGETRVRFTVLEMPAAAPELVDIVPGFPAEVRGRMLFLPSDNLNTDGIYGKDYTYRDDVTREEMARVVMQNYDPEFALRAGEGDVIVAGANFGTGSSREQAVTALQARGIRMVIATSFSQTYLRNAFNNGFLCVECPELVAAAKRDLTGSVTGAKTVISGDVLDIDFRSGSIRWRGQVFHFQALGSVPQSLVAAGGIENLVRSRFAAAAV